MPKIVYLDNLPAQEGVSILENQNKIKVVKIESNNLEPVSYTHLTLPTICSV